MSTAELHLLGQIFYGGALGLVLIGLYGIIVCRNLVRIVLAMGLLEAGVNLFLVAVGFRPDAAAPIVRDGLVTAMVDPLPQALILTAIVIGVAVMALALALVVRTQRAYHTLDSRELARHIATVGGEPLPQDGPRPAGTLVPAQRSGGEA